MKLFLLLSLLTITLNVTLAQSNPDTSNKGNSGLINETMLHPGDAFTGEVLEKNTLLIGWSLLPPDILPGWIIYGVTNRLTIETDILNWLGAVPNLNVRFALLRPKHGNISVAYETMFIYLPKRIDIVLPKDLSFSLEGIDWYQRMSLTWILRNNFRLHVSAGVSYIQSIELQNTDSIPQSIRKFRNLADPAASLAIDWRPTRWLSYHAAASYSSTFTYLDNIPLKQQVSFATRIVPFVNNKHGFLNKFRIELAFISFYFKDADKRYTGPVAYCYWQGIWK